MTTERKIEILENCKVLLSEHYKSYGICRAFYVSCTWEEILKGNIRDTAINNHIGELFLKHKPNDIKINYHLWWNKDIDGLKIRLSVIDKMILELKTTLV